MTKSVDRSPRPIVFVFSNLTYPAAEGQHVNNWLLIREMKAAGRRVAVLALVRRGGSFDFEALKKDSVCLDFIQIIPTRLNYPLLLLMNLISGGRLGRVQSALNRALSTMPSAVVHLEGIGLMPLMPRLGGYPVVATTTDAWSLRQSRLSNRALTLPKRWFLRCYAALSGYVERRYFPMAGAVQVVSPVDAEYLRQTVPTAQLEAIPIALPSPINAASARPIKILGELPTVLFWGDIRVRHISDGLSWLITEVLPFVKQAAHWVVLGRAEPDQFLKALAPGVKFINWVDSVDDFLRSADVIVLPDAAGTGLKNRAVHAMACGVPVVGTPSAFEGFGATDEVTAMIKAEPAAFANAIDRLLSNHDLNESMSISGRGFAVRGYSLDSVMRKWAALYDRVQPRSVSEN